MDVRWPFSSGTKTAGGSLVIRHMVWRRVEPPPSPYPPHMETSAEARVVASFTFIVALLLGAWGALDRLAGLLDEPEFAGLGIALMPFVATAVAFQAAKSAEAAWARVLGGAAVMLGVLSSLGGALYFLASY